MKIYHKFLLYQNKWIHPYVRMTVEMCIRDRYWNEDFWRNYNIIEPTESLENAVNKLRKHYN